MQSFIDGEAIKITELLMPWIAILLSLINSIMVKRFCTKLYDWIKVSYELCL